MSTLEVLLEQIDQLSEADQVELQKRLAEKRTMMIYTVPGDQMKEIMDIFEPVRQHAAMMTEEEINEVIDEAIEEVRAERLAKIHH